MGRSACSARARSAPRSSRLPWDRPSPSPWPSPASWTTRSTRWIGRSRIRSPRLLPARRDEGGFGGIVSGAEASDCVEAHEAPENRAVLFDALYEHSHELDHDHVLPPGGGDAAWIIQRHDDGAR